MLKPSSCGLMWDKSLDVLRYSELTFSFYQPISFQKTASASPSATAPNAAVVPIAGSLPLLLSGLGILGWAARRRARVLA
jgi:hypothetical protein